MKFTYKRYDKVINLRDSSYLNKYLFQNLYNVRLFVLKSNHFIDFFNFLGNIILIYENNVYKLSQLLYIKFIVFSEFKIN